MAYSVYPYESTLRRVSGIEGLFEARRGETDSIPACMQMVFVVLAQGVRVIYVLTDCRRIVILWMWS